MSEITDEEKYIITTAARAALSFGSGVLSACKEEVEDYGYTWTEAHDKYVFENFILNESY